VFPAWFSKWILDYAELHSAVIISPDYRLLPEVKGTDILDDMAAFWTWFHKGGPSGILQQSGYREKLDPSKLLLLGESAGGYLAVQSVLSGFVEPDAMVLLYPMLDMKADHYTKEYNKPIVNVPNFPSNLVVDFLATLPPTDDKRHEQAITEADPPARLDLALASVQMGRYLDFIGTDPRLFVLDRIESGDYARRKSGKGAVLPLVFLLHGNEDSAVPIQGSHRFLEVLKKADRNAPVHAAFRSGDHGFDFQATLDDEWLLAGLKWAEEEWLVERSKM
jgi:acetyl esterase/lipase